MAYTTLAVQAITKAGLKPVYVAATAADGDKFKNTGAEFLHIVNGSGTACVVTVLTPAKVSGLDIENKAISIPAGEEKMIGPFQPGLYNNMSGADVGTAYVTYSQVVTVTVAAFRA